MISLWLKHYVFDRFINSVFDGMIKTFSKEQLYKVGDRFNTIVNAPYVNNHYNVSMVYYNVVITEIYDILMYGTYEKYIKHIKYHDLKTYNNAIWHRSRYRDMCEFNNRDNTIKITERNTDSKTTMFPYNWINYSKKKYR